LDIRTTVAGIMAVGIIAAAGTIAAVGIITVVTAGATITMADGRPGRIERW